MELPLSGVRVLEVAGGIPAAFAAHLLGGYGADVVRAEGSSEADGSLTDDEATYLLAGRRRVEVGADDALLRRLALAADLVVEDQAPGALARRGCGPPELRAERPELVVVSLTPFGQDGPYAGYQATNAVSFAMGGIMSMTGDISRTPLLSGGSQALYLGGLNGFSAAVTAWLGRLVQGEGDWVDISLQECAASMVELYLPGTAYGMPVQLRTGNQVRATWGLYPCVDGYAGAFCLERQIPGLFAALDDPELDEARFRDPLQRLEPPTADEMLAKMYVFFADKTKADVLEIGATHRIPVGVVMTPADLLASPGLSERDFWDDVELPSGEVARVPGRPFPGLGWLPGGSPARRRRGHRGRGGRAGWAAPVKRLPARGRPGARPHDDVGRALRHHAAGRDGRRGVEGRVADRPGTTSAPCCPSPAWPIPGTRRTTSTATTARRSRSRSTWPRAEGRALFLRLVQHVDVLIENYRADVLDKLGLGWDVLREAKADLVVVSMAAFGKAGPDAGLVGFGPVIEMMSGLVSLSGYGDGEPFKTGISYGDPVAGHQALAAAVLGLIHRRRTGEGCAIDLAQRETGSVMAGEAFVAASLRGEEPTHWGTRSPRFVPQGCYRAADSPSSSTWAATSSGWSCPVGPTPSGVPWPGWSAAPTWPRWRGRSGWPATTSSTRRSGPGSGARTPRRPWSACRRDGRARRAGARHRQRASTTPTSSAGASGSTCPTPRCTATSSSPRRGVSSRPTPSLRRHSPMFGEHNREVLGGVLGLGDEELADLAARGVIGDAPLQPRRRLNPPPARTAQLVVGD